MLLEGWKNKLPTGWKQKIWVERAEHLLRVGQKSVLMHKREKSLPGGWSLKE